MTAPRGDYQRPTTVDRTTASDAEFHARVAPIEAAPAAEESWDACTCPETDPLVRASTYTVRGPGIEPHAVTCPRWGRPVTAAAGPGRWEDEESVDLTPGVVWTDEQLAVVRDLTARAVAAARDLEALRQAVRDLADHYGRMTVVHPGQALGALLNDLRALLPDTDSERQQR